MKYVHFELAQESRRSLNEAEVGPIGSVLNIQNTQRCECNSAVADCKDVYRLMRVSCESFLELEGSQLKVLSDLCLAAHRSEEFFLVANATDQWVRTLVGHEDLPPATWTKLETRAWSLTSLGAKTWSKVMIPNIVIHSNVLPYDPYWSKLRATRDGAYDFPCCVLEEALEERKTLKTKLEERISCEIGAGLGRRSCEPSGKCGLPRFAFQLFREIEAAEVEFVRELTEGSDGTISLITWRGGKFIQKKLKSEKAIFDAELDVVKRFCHAHIVYSFGKLCDGKQSSYFMECMSQDLFSFIADIERDRTRRRVDCNKPPFSPHDSVDILSQIAKAMSHMHQPTVNVVHCDLKTLNILISEINVPSEKTVHYLVKVADFGSARLLGNSGGFIPGNGTTEYSAPEVLMQRTDKAVCINSPHKIDVYSFGIVAFEVLTGEKVAPYKRPSISKFKKGVTEGTWRPPLREECEKHEAFIQDTELISLVEKCWRADPLERPDFENICEELDKARIRILIFAVAVCCIHEDEWGTHCENVTTKRPPRLVVKAIRSHASSSKTSRKKGCRRFI